MLDVEAIHAEYERRCAAQGVVPFELVVASHPTHAAELRDWHEERILDLFLEYERECATDPALRLASFAARFPWAEAGLIATGEADAALRDLSSVFGVGNCSVLAGRAAGAVPLDPVAPAVQPGGQLDRYEIKRELGHGRYGSVFEAWDTALRRLVALKLMNPAYVAHEELRDRFVQEAQIASQLDHPCAPAVYDLGVTPTGVPYFALQLVKGESFASWLARRRPRVEGADLHAAIEVLVRVAELVHYAQTVKKVDHRDLKPANVMVARNGGTYVIDWGLARLSGSVDEATPDVGGLGTGVAMSDRRLRSIVDGSGALRTREGVPIGTLHYVAPERVDGTSEVTGVLADVYSLGAILYEVLAGRPPYSGLRLGGTQEALLQHIARHPPEHLEVAAPGRDAALVAIARRAMEREPLRRYASVGAFGTELRRWLAQGTAAASPGPPGAAGDPAVEPIGERAPHPSRLTAALALGVAFALGLWIDRLFG